MALCHAARRFLTTRATLATPPRLPRLPLPALDATCTKYLASLSPLLTDDEARRVEPLVEQLRTTEGPRLHAELTRLAALPPGEYPESWIEGFWDDMYLNGRWALPINSNPYLAWDNDTGVAADQSARAAAITASAIKFAHSVLTQRLEVGYASKRPLDPFQFSRMFAGSRVPERGRDRIVPKAYKPGDLDTIVVLHGGRVFELNVLDRATGAMADQATLRQHFSAIVNGPSASSPELGIATTLERDSWATLRGRMMRTPLATTIRALDACLFVVSLDEWSQGLRHSTCEETFLHGHSQSHALDRWFDKPIQLLITPEGEACVNFEHSWGDGVPVGRLMHEVWHDTHGTPSGFDKLRGAETYGVLPAAKEPPRQLVSSDSAFAPELATARKAYERACEVVGVKLLMFEHYGKNAIKSWRLSPDSFVQMAFQLAWHRVYGGVVSTYESCNMSHFHHGRTEAIRSATTESRRFVEQFDQTANRLVLMGRAVTAHNVVAEQAREGHGWDRHLYGMLNIAKRDQLLVPGVFADPTWAKYNANLISTSTVTLPFMRHAGFGAVHPDGYGIAYVVHDNRINVCVTAYSSSATNRGAAEFLHALERALLDMRDAAHKADA